MKIRKAFEQFEAAEARGVKLQVLNELSNLWGAMRKYLKRYPGIKMNNLHQMDKVARRERKGKR